MRPSSPVISIRISAPALHQLFFCVGTRRFWELVFNPAGLPIEEEERQFLAARLDQLIDHEGLEDPDMTLAVGYITRGNALHFMHETNQQLYAIKDRLERQREEEQMRQEL